MPLKIGVTGWTLKMGFDPMSKIKSIIHTKGNVFTPADSNGL